MKPPAVPRLVFVPCHRLPARSLSWRGRQLPVCARCTGMLAGYLAFPVFAFLAVPLGWLWAGLLLNLPAWLDGATQALGWRESTNALRLATGVLSGVGQIVAIAALGQWSGRWLVLFFQGAF